MDDTATTLSANGRAALAYVNMGLGVMPLRVGSKRPASENGSKDASTDREQIELAWSAYPDMNVGVATGAASGNLVIIDCDVDEDTGEDGLETVNRWQREHGAWPDTACSTTPRGGEHFWFRVPQNVRNSTNADLGVDVRGMGGYAVAPPSSLPNGEYEWDMDIEDYGISDANQSVLDFIEWVGSGKKGEFAKFHLPDKIRKGERNNTLFKYGCSLRSNGYDPDYILDALRNANSARCTVKMTDSELKQIAESVVSRYEEGHSDEFGKERADAEKVTEADEAKMAVLGELTTDGKGRVKNTVRNAMCVLDNDPRFAGRFRYDEMAYTKTVDLPLPWDGGEGTRPLKDTDYTNFYAIIESEYNIASKDKAIDAVANVCNRNRYNPVRDWLESLEWDGTERVKYLLPMFFGVEPTDYQAEVMGLVMRGAIARATHPGCKFDYVLIIHGAQGIGKSHFFSMLAHRPEWFTDGVKKLEGDATIEKLRGKWIIEFGELLAMKRTQDVEGIKTFLTSQYDNIRPKYARETEDRPRVCIFTGSTNRSVFLSDPTGNRRFLVIDSPLKMNQPTMYMFADDAQDIIDQAWAEAYAKWKAGDTELRLARDIETEAEDARNDHSEFDPRIGMTQEYLDYVLAEWRQHGKPEPAPRVCAREVAERKLGYSMGDVPPKVITDVNEILREHVSGWRKYPNKNGNARCGTYGTQRCYVPCEQDDGKGPDGGCSREHGEQLTL